MSLRKADEQTNLNDARKARLTPKEREKELSNFFNEMDARARASGMTPTRQAPTKNNRDWMNPGH